MPFSLSQTNVENNGQSLGTALITAASGVYDLELDVWSHNSVKEIS
jgi:hypothetical protein